MDTPTLAVAAPALAPPRVGARPRTSVAAIAALALLFILALAPRTLLIRPFVTPDEDNWMRRIGNFSRAIERGQFRQTYQSGHPGVTTMWIGRLALGAEASRLAGQTPPDPVVTLMPDFMELLGRARFAFAAANSALIVVIALLVGRLFGPSPGALSGGLMAFDPFSIAHSQVVHLDALAAHLMTVAVLAGVGFWWGGVGGRSSPNRAPAWGYLALCAVGAGLAILTKAPSLFLGAFLPFVAIGGLLSRRGDAAYRRLWLRSVVLCGLAVIATLILFWPALWVAPIETVRRGVEYTVLQAGTPHGPGNFFNGQPTADPGGLYYLVAVAFRTTPTVVAGLAALAVMLPPPAVRRQALVLIAFLLGFLFFLAVASKKLDRYALPLMPTLAILASLGLSLVWPSSRYRLGRGAAIAAIVALTVTQALWLTTALPYPLAYYNPLAGGGAGARGALLVGWGEGLDQAAEYLNAQPDAAGSRIAVYYPLVRNFQAVVAGTVQRHGDPYPVDYVVDYVNATQRRQTPPELNGLTPDHTVRINGIVYARVYRLSPARLITSPPPVVPRAQPLPVPQGPDQDVD